MTEPVHIDAGPAEKQQRARSCSCDRPMVFRDAEIGLICGRCGREPVDQGGHVQRAPRALAAAAAPRAPRAPAAPRPLPRQNPTTYTARALALAAELGEITAADVAERLPMPQQRAGVLLSQMQTDVPPRLVRVGTRPGRAPGRPLNVYSLPEDQAA